MAESGATAVFWNRRYEPTAVARDSVLELKLREHGLLAESFNGSLLFEPGTIRNQSGTEVRLAGTTPTGSGVCGGLCTSGWGDRG